VGLLLIVAMAMAQPQFYPSGQNFPHPSLPQLPSEMKYQPPEQVMQYSERDFGNQWGDDMNEELRDPRNFGPPPSLSDIKKRREDLDRERASSSVPGMKRSASRLAQWLPDQDAPHRKAQEQLAKVKGEMGSFFGQGSDYARAITRLGDVAIEAEVVPHRNAAKELKYMDGKGNNDEFFDVDFNHPIDSTAIQRGVAAIKQSRNQHSQWTEEEKSKKGATNAGASTPAIQSPTALTPNLRSLASHADPNSPAGQLAARVAARMPPRPFSPQNPALGGGVISRATITNKEPLGP